MSAFVNSLYIFIYLFIALMSCSRDELDPSLAKLDDTELRKILTGTTGTKWTVGIWEKETEDGYEQIVLSKTGVEYLMNKKLGSAYYKRDSYDFVRTKHYISVRFMKKGLVMQEEKITSISNDTWENAIDGHIYKKR